MTLATFRTAGKGKGTWEYKPQLPVAGSFVSEFRLGPPSGIKPYDVQDEDADDEDDELMADFAKKQHGASKKKKTTKRRRLVK